MDESLMKKNQESMTPGVGVAGQVMCPLSLMAPKMCIKQGCEMWVELTYGEVKVARCSFAWSSILMVELRQEIQKLIQKVQSENNKNNESTNVKE